MDIAASWSQAGGVCRRAAVGLWWVAVDREDWPQDGEYRKLIDAKWVESWGDRRRELVFMGIGMDREAIETLLEACLLNADEMAQGPAAWNS
jgi:G3E family GTPase